MDLHSAVRMGEGAVKADPLISANPYAVYVKKTTIYAIFHFINKIHATIMLTKNNSSMGFIFYCCDSNNTHFCINNTTIKIWGNHKTDVSGRKSTDDVR